MLRDDRNWTIETPPELVCGSALGTTGLVQARLGLVENGPPGAYLNHHRVADVPSYLAV